MFPLALADVVDGLPYAALTYSALCPDALLLPFPSQYPRFLKGLASDLSPCPSLAPSPGKSRATTPALRLSPRCPPQAHTAARLLFPPSSRCPSHTSTVAPFTLQTQVRPGSHTPTHTRFPWSTLSPSPEVESSGSETVNPDQDFVSCNQLSTQSK